MDFVPKSLLTRFPMVNSARPSPLASPLMDCLGLSLMDGGTASTFPDVWTVRDRPDLRASSRLLPGPSLDLISWTVLNPTPQSSAACSSDFQDRARVLHDKLSFQLIIHD